MCSKYTLWDLFYLIMLPYNTDWLLKEEQADELFWPEAAFVLCDSQYDSLYSVYHENLSFAEASRQYGMKDSFIRDAVNRAIYSLRTDRILYIIKYGELPEAKPLMGDTALSMMPMSKTALCKLKRRDIITIEDLSGYTVDGLTKRFGMRGDYLETIDAFMKTKAFKEYKRRRKS